MLTHVVAATHRRNADVALYTLRSIRAIDATRVEAKYSYRVTRTTCEGTALLETERVGNETFIRRIRANC